MYQLTLIAQLLTRYQLFTDYVATLSAEEFEWSANGKWTAGQQLVHLCLSIKPLVRALWLPAFLLKLGLGKANRPSKMYDQLVAKYVGKLATGGQAPSRFVPQPVSAERRAEHCRQLMELVKQLARQIEGLTEDNLDTIIAPHPLLGRVTLREMMYFTIYHAEHHQNTIKNQLANRGQPT